MAKLPIITHRREIDVRVVYGQNIFELYQQIHNLIQRELPQLANLFAEPVVNAVRGEISWNTKATGSVLAGTALGDAEWSSLGSRLKKDLSLIQGLIAKLEKAGRSNSAGTEALRCMLVTPDLRRSVFQVGSQCVITQWGCYEFGSDARSADVFEQIEAAPKATLELQTPSSMDAPPSTGSTFLEDKPISEQVQAAAPAPPPASSPLPSTRASPTPAADSASGLDPSPETTLESPSQQVAEKFFPWRWLLLSLLILLLLAGLFLKYWQTRHHSSESALKAEIAQLTNALDKKISDCALQTPSVDSSAALTPPVSNSEFSSRQADNQIQPDSRVNVSLAWNDRSDLDLWIIQPDGEFVFHGPCKGGNCGRLDVDANRCDMRGPPCTSLTDRPLENISWPNKMLPGRYLVAVALYSTNRLASEARPVRFTVQITKNGVVSNFEGLVRTDEIQCKDNLCGTAPRRVTQFTVE
jgi:hypothetical protein